jgi:hypothetical protein
LSWSETGERKIFGPDLVTEAEDKVKIIQANLKAAQSRQKSYADQRRKPLQFQIGDYVYLRVSPTKGVQRFGIKGKLAPRYVEPFEITEACGPVAYKIHLPSQLAAIHDVFHISQLKKCIKIPTEILEPQAIKIEPDLSYSEQPIQILDTKERTTRKKKIKMYKILWIIILRKKPPRKLKIIFRRTSPNSLRLFRYLSSKLYHSCNLEMRFFLGGKVVTVKFRY